MPRVMVPLSPDAALLPDASLLSELPPQAVRLRARQPASIMDNMFFFFIGIPPYFGLKITKGV